MPTPSAPPILSVSTLGVSRAVVGFHRLVGGGTIGGVTVVVPPRRRLSGFIAGAAALIYSGSSAADIYECPVTMSVPPSPFEDLAVDVPADAAPWVVTYPCEEPPKICEFVPERGGGAGTVAAELTSSTCTELHLLFSYLKASSPLQSGDAYWIRCDGRPVLLPRRFRVGEREIEAATLVDASVRREFSEGCCDTHLLAISAQIEGQTLEGFGAQGGLFRVDLGNAQTWFAPPEALDWWRFPDWEGEVTVTALSVQGEALGSVRVSPEEFSRDRVYIPCAVDLRGRPSLLLWLLAPLAWLRLSRRRRRLLGAP